MNNRNVRRGIAVLGLAVAAVVPALASPAAAQASPTKVSIPGLLRLTPSSGQLTDNPIAAYKTTKACPADHRALGAVVLQGSDGTPNFLGGNFTPTDAKPSGTLEGSSLQSVVLAAGLTTGYYEVDVQCYNDDFSDAADADVNVIRIDVENGTWCSLVSIRLQDFAEETR